MWGRRTAQLNPKNVSNNKLLLFKTSKVWDGLLHTGTTSILLYIGHIAVLSVPSLMSATDRNGTEELHSRMSAGEEVEYGQTSPRILALPLTSCDPGQET